MPQSVKHCSRFFVLIVVVCRCPPVIQADEPAIFGSSGISSRPATSSIQMPLGQDSRRMIPDRVSLIELSGGHGSWVAGPAGKLWQPASSWLDEMQPLTAVRSLQTDAVATRTEKKSPSRSDTPVAGTWRDDGRYVTLNIGGRQVRLMKEGTPTDDTHRDTTIRTAAQIEADGELSAARQAGGTVSGRLLNGRRALVECRVSLIPLRKTLGQYEVNGEREPHAAVTNEYGNYHFENVPLGPYKLFWLPKGQRRWIRRVAYRPDVVVRSNRLSEIKDIRLSLNTVN